MGGMGTGNLDRDIYYAEVTRKLKVGSPAIDQMKKEIDSVVNGILGLVTRRERFLNCEDPLSVSGSNPFTKSFHEVFYSPVPFYPVCEWRIFGSKAYESTMTWLVECYLKSAMGDLRAYTMIGGSSAPIGFQNAQRVYESLPVFIEGMAKTFPFLTESWQPMLDAADYAEKNGW